MTLTAHISVACAVGVATKSPTLGFFAGFLSHHIIDAIPHSDAGSLGSNIYNALQNKALKYIIIDVAAAAIIFFLIWNKNGFSSIVFWSAVGGALPDVIDNSPYWSQYTRKVFPTNYYHRFHETVHYTILSQKYFWVGIATQLVLIAVSSYYIFILK